MNSKYYLIGFILLLLFTGITFADSTNSTINITTSNTLTSGLITQSSNSTLNSTVNVTKATTLFSSFTKPFLGILDTVSLLLFLVVFAVGEYIIYRKETENVEAGISLSPFVIYGVLSSVILLFPFILSSYATIVPTFLKSLTNYSLASSFSYEVSGMIVIASVLSFVAFILFLKTIFDILIAYTDPEKRNEAERNIRRIIIMLAFVLFSPYVLIVLYLGFSEVLISISNAFATSFAQLIHTQNIPLFHQYVSNYEGCVSAPAFWQILDEIKCGAANGIYLLSVNFYPYTLQLKMFNAIAVLMSGAFSDVALNQLIFSLIFGIIMIWSFAIVDYKLLQYVTNINSEREQESFREVKARVLQYTTFMLSPALYIIFIILMGSLVVILTGMIFTVSSGTFSFSPIPPLLAIVAYPTVTNPIVYLAGLIGLIFVVILLAVVALFALLKILAASLFSIGIYWYFSDVPHIKAFGERIFYILIAIFLLPIIALFAYSIFFGALPSLLFSAMPSGTVQTGTVFGYDVASAGANNATITGPGLSSGYTFQCNSVGSVSQFETYILNNLGGSQEAYSALIYACSNYITGYSTSIIIIEIVALALLIFGTLSLIHTGGAGLMAPITTFTSNIRAGKFGEAFSGLAADTSKTFSAVTKPFTKVAKQTYTYAKQPLVGTVEGAILEGTVAAGVAITTSVPTYISKKNQELQEKKKDTTTMNDSVRNKNKEVYNDLESTMTPEEMKKLREAGKDNIDEAIDSLEKTDKILADKIRKTLDKNKNYKEYSVIKEAAKGNDFNKYKEAIKNSNTLSDDEKNELLKEANDRQRFYKANKDIEYGAEYKNGVDVAFEERNNYYKNAKEFRDTYQRASSNLNNINEEITKIKNDKLLTKKEKD
ncbi:MAG: hypothetical protein QXU98_10390, partial [Candidatus Parvarchaeota archaeon]